MTSSIDQNSRRATQLRMQRPLAGDIDSAPQRYVTCINNREHGHWPRDNDPVECPTCGGDTGLAPLGSGKGFRSPDR